MNYLYKGIEKMAQVSSGESQAGDTELIVMLLAGIGEQLDRIATALERADPELL